MDINSYSIGGYFKLNYHKLLMGIGDYSIVNHWCLMRVILLLPIFGYPKLYYDYYWLF